MFRLVSLDDKQKQLLLWHNPLPIIMPSDKEIRAWANLGQDCLFAFSGPGFLIAPSPPSRALTPSFGDAPRPFTGKEMRWGCHTKLGSANSKKVAFLIIITTICSLPATCWALWETLSILSLEPSVRYYGLHFTRNPQTTASRPSSFHTKCYHEVLIECLLCY